MNITPPERAPLNEISRWYGISYQYLYGLVRAGTLPAENLGTDERAKWWLRTSDVETFLEGRRSA